MGLGGSRRDREGLGGSKTVLEIASIPCNNFQTIRLNRWEILLNNKWLILPVM